MGDASFPMSAVINSDNMACPDKTQLCKGHLERNCTEDPSQRMQLKCITLNNSQSHALIAARRWEGRFLRDSFIF